MYSSAAAHGRVVNWNTFATMSRPVGTCHKKRPILMALNPIWRLRAVSLPFCMEGTRAAAIAQSTTIPAPAYKCGPGKSFPVLRNVLQGPAMAISTPSPRMRDPQLWCLSFNFCPIRSFLSCTTHMSIHAYEHTFINQSIT